MFIPVIIYAIFFLNPQNISATHLQCQEAFFETIDEQDDSLFEFVAHMHCSSDQIKPLYELQDDVFTYFVKHPSYTIYSTQSNVNYKNFEGKKLTVREDISSGNGDLKVYSDMYIVGDQDKHFLLDSMSTKIDAEGNAKTTKYNGLSVRIDIKHDQASEVVITKHAIVKKPWIAPKSYFINRVKSGIKNSLTIIKNEYESIIIEP